MNLHITPSFNIDRLCKTASVLPFLVTVDFVRGHVCDEYSKRFRAGIEGQEKFKMATKMGAERVFILELVYIDVHVVFVSSCDVVYLILPHIIHKLFL